MAGLIYNVTVSVSSDTEEKWVQWMKEKHIPEVMDTGCFSGFKILKLIDGNHGTEPTFAIQYFCKTEKDLELYRAKYAEALQKEHSRLFEGKFAAFRTVLQDIS